jgi:hypothetical protein
LVVQLELLVAVQHRYKFVVRTLHYNANFLKKQS